jgi:hypothetical protein
MTPSREAVVGLAGFAWALGWFAARQAGFGQSVSLLAAGCPGSSRAVLPSDPALSGVA